MVQPCFHCGEKVPPGFQASLQVQGKTEPFCCYGCLAIAETIVSDGLDNFYSHRTHNNLKPENFNQADHEQLELYDDPLLQADFVSSYSDKHETSLSISGITCAACIWLLERELNRFEQVDSFTINHTTHKAALVWQTGLKLSDVLLKVRQLGYKAKPYRYHEAKLAAIREKRLSIFRIAIAGIASMQNMMFSIPLYLGMYNDLDVHLIDLFRWVSMFMAAPVVLFAAQPFYRSAWRSLRARTLGMDVPVSIAILCAYFASAFTTVTTEPSLHSDVYFDSVSMFAFFLLLGRFIEMQSRHRYLSDDADIDQLLPETAIIQDSGMANEQEKSIIAQRICEGDILIVKQGSLAPADGVVIAGTSRFDESALSGEYLPVAKSTGDIVHAGTANMENTIRLRVIAIPAKSRISSILRLISQAQASKPKTQRLADGIASYFVAGVLLAAALTGLYWQLVDADKVFVTVLSVLVVTCPCALSLATPTALTSATSALRRRGFLLAKNHVLESMVAASDVVFDKTGTLTRGELSISQTHSFGDQSIERLTAIASALESHAHHPIARAFTQSASLTANNIENKAGYGLSGIIENERYYIGSRAYIEDELGTNAIPVLPEATGPSVILANKHEVLASFELNDHIREEASATIATLKGLGLQVHILSGDHRSSVEYVGHELGISSLHYAQSPEQKLAIVESLQHQRRKVVMVGDGINDLPVIAKSDLSIAMGSASDLTKMNADAVLLNDHLSVLGHAFSGARQTKRIIIENMSWALAYNICMLPLAASSFVPPYFAALGMSLSSLVVVFNSIRLRKL